MGPTIMCIEAAILGSGVGGLLKKKKHKVRDFRSVLGRVGRSREWI